MLSALTLTACAGSTASVKPDLRPAPGALTVACASPAKLPARGLSKREVETYWRRDRANLVSCKDRHGAVVTYYRQRDGRLIGGRDR